MSEILINALVQAMVTLYRQTWYEVILINELNIWNRLI